MACSTAGARAFQIAVLPPTFERGVHLLCCATGTRPLNTVHTVANTVAIPALGIVAVNFSSAAAGCAFVYHVFLLAATCSFLAFAFRYTVAATPAVACIEAWNRAVPYDGAGRKAWPQRLLAGRGRQLNSFQNSVCDTGPLLIVIAASVDA